MSKRPRASSSKKKKKTKKNEQSSGASTYALDDAALFQSTAPLDSLESGQYEDEGNRLDASSDSDFASSGKKKAKRRRVGGGPRHRAKPGAFRSSSAQDATVQPKAAREAYRSGVNAMTNGDMVEAEAAFIVAVRAAEGWTQPLRMLALVHEEAGREDKAFEARFKAAKAENAERQVDIGMEAQRLGRLEEAIAIFKVAREKAEAGSDLKVKATVAMAHCLRDQGAKEESLKAWNGLLRMREGNVSFAVQVYELNQELGHGLRRPLEVLQESKDQWTASFFSSWPAVHYYLEGRLSVLKRAFPMNRVYRAVHPADHELHSISGFMVEETMKEMAVHRRSIVVDNPSPMLSLMRSFWGDWVSENDASNTHALDCFMLFLMAQQMYGVSNLHEALPLLLAADQDSTSSDRAARLIFWLLYRDNLELAGVVSDAIEATSSPFVNLRLAAKDLALAAGDEALAMRHYWTILAHVPDDVDAHEWAIEYIALARESRTPRKLIECLLYRLISAETRDAHVLPLDSVTDHVGSWDLVNPDKVRSWSPSEAHLALAATEAALDDRDADVLQALSLPFFSTLLEDFHDDDEERSPVVKRLVAFTQSHNGIKVGVMMTVLVRMATVLHSLGATEAHEILVDDADKVRQSSALGMARRWPSTLHGIRNPASPFPSRARFSAQSADATARSRGKGKGKERAMSSRDEGSSRTETTFISTASDATGAGVGFSSAVKAKSDAAAVGGVARKSSAGTGPSSGGGGSQARSRARLPPLGAWVKSVAASGLGRHRRRLGGYARTVETFLHGGEGSVTVSAALWNEYNQYLVRLYPGPAAIVKLALSWIKAGDVGDDDEEDDEGGSGGGGEDGEEEMDEGADELNRDDERHGGVRASNELYQRLAQNAGKLWMSWSFVGYRYLSMKEYAAGLDAFQRALELEPLESSSLFGAAMACALDGSVDESLEYLCQYVRVSGGGLEPMFNAGRLCHQVGLWKQAVGYYDGVIAAVLESSGAEDVDRETSTSTLGRSAAFNLVLILRANGHVPPPEHDVWKFLTI